MLLPQEGFDSIVHDETGGEAYYNKFALHPIVPPGNAAGVTIGVGYDLGSQDEATFRREWQDFLLPSQMDRLTKVLGLQGVAARRRVGGLAEISIPFASAIEQFTKFSLPRYYWHTHDALPHFGELPGLCQSALVSLVYNRGHGGFTASQDRFREMRDMRAAMDARDWPTVADRIRAQRRLWPPVKGKTHPLAARREREADMFARGLADMVPGEPEAPTAPVQDDPADDLAQSVADAGGRRAKVAQAQRLLRERGYFEVGTIDGFLGDRTKDAIRAFRRNAGLADSVEVDDELMAALADPTNQRPIAPERAAITAEDLRKRGSETIGLTDRIKKLGAGLLGGGAAVGTLGQGSDIADRVSTGTQFFRSVKELMVTVGLTPASLVWIAASGGGVLFVAHLLEKHRVKAARTGEHL